MRILRLRLRQWPGIGKFATSITARQQTTSNSSSFKIGVPPTVASSSPLTVMPEAKFHDIADHTLEAIMSLLSPLESELDDVDISSSQGVLNVNLGSGRGFWVINKQTPNRQLWWSSPLSGPRRYEYNPTPSMLGLDLELESIAHWKATIDGKDMLWQLHKEMQQVAGMDLLKRAS